MSNLESWDHLALAREAKDMTQAELAKKLGLSQQNYHNYEHGREMKAGMLKQVCAILECSPSWLLGMAEEGEQLPPESPLLKALKESFGQLNVKGQKKVVGYAEDLTGNVEYTLKVKKERVSDDPLPKAVGE